MHCRLLAFPFHLFSLVSLAEKPFGATPFRVGTVQSVVPFLVSSDGLECVAEWLRPPLKAQSCANVFRF